MDLTLTQKKILKLLAINCRFSNQDIAKAVGVSADTVKYQINNFLHKKKLITFAPQFDYRKVGFGHYHYLIRLKDIKKLNLENLKAIKSITFINTSQGKYDLQLIVVARNELELEKHLKLINQNIKENIQDFSLMKFVSQYKFTHLIPELHLQVRMPQKKKSSVYKLNKESFHVEETFEKIELDNLDYKLIGLLLKNPRATYLDLSRKLNTSHETIRYRITGYIKNKLLLNFGAWQNYEKYGYFANYLFLKLKSYDEDKFGSWILNNPKVFYAARLIGEFNCIIYVLSKTPKDFNEQTKKIREFFADKLIDIELLYFEKIVKSVQFPELLL